jgi:hypothetical protein
MQRMMIPNRFLFIFSVFTKQLKWDMEDRERKAAPQKFTPIVSLNWNTEVFALQTITIQRMKRETKQ